MNKGKTFLGMFGKHHKVVCRSDVALLCGAAALECGDLSPLYGAPPHGAALNPSREASSAYAHDRSKAAVNRRTPKTLRVGKTGVLLSPVFTLIELLLTVAIMAILMAILFPALAKVKETAKRINCVNNLKQNGISAAMYANDFNGFLFVYKSWTDGNPEQGWADPLWEMSYLTKRNQSLCPSAPPYTYSPSTFNNKIYGAWMGDTANIPMLKVSPGVWSFRKLTVLNNVSTAAFLQDSINISGKTQVWATAGSSSTGIHLRHSNTANCLFLDFHVESLDFASLTNCGMFPTVDYHAFDANYSQLR